jgi:hypothetical protein
MTAVASRPSRVDLRLTPTTLLILALAASGPFSYFASSFVDHAQKVRDSSGQLVWTSDGDAARLISIVFAFVELCLAIYLLASRRRKEESLGRAQMFFIASAWAIVLAGALRYPQTSISSIFHFATAALCLAPLARGLDWTSLRSLAIVGRLVYMTNIAYFLLFDNAANECRSDKCSIVGALVRGYFPHENTLAMYVCLLLPFSFNSRAKYLAMDVVATAFLVASTGSRIGIGMWIIALIALLAARHLARPQTWRLVGSVAPLMRLLPTIGLAASLFVYLFSSPLELTGRGFIYALTLDEVKKHWLIGPGREILQVAYDQGRSAGFLIAHEHGEAPYLLTNGGVLAFSLFALATMALCVSRTPLLAVMAGAPASIAFVTEPVWEFSTRSPLFFSLALTVALAKPRDARSGTDADVKVVGG